MRITSIAERTHNHESQRNREEPNLREDRSQDSSNSKEEQNKSDTSYHDLTDQPTTFWFNNYEKSFSDIDPTITRGQLQTSLSELQNLHPKYIQDPHWMKSPY